jgi:hypothetical protein
VSAKKLLLSTLLGGVIAFAFGFISWDLVQWHPITSFTNEDATVAAIRANAPKSGIYLMPSGQTAPGADKAASEKAMMDRMKTGPVIFASIQAQGMGDNYAMFFVTGALIDFAGALFISWLVMMVPGTTYGKRLQIIMMVALIAGILVCLPNWAWWGFSTAYTASMFVDLVVGWGLAGLAMAKFTG